MAAIKSRHDSDDGHHLEGEWGAAEDRRAAHDHVDAGGHHGGRVNERADRRGAFHGVRQPDVKGNLCALSRGSDEQEQSRWR